MKETGRTANKIDEPFLDLTRSQVRIASVPKVGVRLDHLVMIAGFTDKGLVGSICINQIVQQLGI